MWLRYEGPGGQTGTERDRNRTEGSKASVFGTLSVVVKQPARLRAGYMLLLVAEIFAVDFKGLIPRKLQLPLALAIM